MRHLLLLLLVCISCTEKVEVKHVEYKRHITLNRNDTLNIPVSLRNQLEEDYFTLSTRPVERTATQKKVLLGNLTREYLPFKVFLTSHKPVLKDESYLFKTDGGGEIDLAQYLSGTVGEFVLGFDLDEKYTASNTRVYFLNNLKAQGCSEYKDITNFFFATMNKKGLITTTKDLIHLKLLVGAVVLISNIEDKYYMGQLYITDSRVKKALCR
ncbi:MAG: hypothetical protein KDD37_06860 [Bdellovibrionales bacterium]|nr:hypothetical protein [Bdellovibrionales bacterium]